MQHRRISSRRTVVAGGAAVALLIAGLTFQSANASDRTEGFTAKKLSATAAGELAASLDKRLGADAAGTYYDAGARTLVVNVVDEAAADSVRDAGGTARIVAHSLAELAAARQGVGDRANVPGTSWAVDPVTNKVVVTADRTVTGAALTRLNQTVRELGDKAELRRTAGEFTPYLAGGDAIHSGGGRCSLGFNVVKDGAPHFITAGHCGQTGSQWSGTAGGSAVGEMVESSFPDNDYALVKYASGATAPSEVNLYNGDTQPIARAGEATVGTQVQRSGSTTQLHDGAVTGLDATVNYGNGDVVNGLIQTSVCAEPGDSGGSLFAGDTALGLTSGGSGNCSAGGVTFFQPVPEVLATFGAEIG
ncbi:S1 family peptidase [Streptomyces sp. NPDC020965]|uniref:S1 family peptidase n=1 Tax=Streptomyces sp. NPDC020965 TaxID=3365105 RepID=UPI0037B95C1E